MSPAASADAKSAFRMIAASFVAGMCAMTLTGFVARAAFTGGFSMANASASTYEQTVPAIEPLDVVAIQAQLAEADRAMATTRAATDTALDRLEGLAGR